MADNLNQRVDLCANLFSFPCPVFSFHSCFRVVLAPKRSLAAASNNLTEIARMRDLRRSVEQAAVFGKNDKAYTVGFIHGIDQTFVRSGVGLYKIPHISHTDP